MTVYFEDIDIGDAVACGSTSLSEREIVEFASKYDPMPIHTDKRAAEDGPFGGIIASGYHTLCLTVNMLVREFRADRAVIAGLGIDNVTWHNPVRPGDTIFAHMEVLDKHISRNNPDRGVVEEHITVTNQHDEIVLSYDDFELVKCRETANDDLGTAQ